MSKKTVAETIYTMLTVTGKVKVSKKLTEEVADAVFANITESVARSGRFAYPAFGSFTAKTRKARTFRSPRTGLAVSKPECTVVSFRPSSTWKTQLAEVVLPPK